MEKKDQIKVYVLMLSKEFPKEHPKAGEQTGFKEKLELALKAQQQSEDCPPASGMMKVHTIRTNFERWSRIMQKVQEGKAVISVRQWKGKPYEKGNVQVEIARLGKDDGIGMQTLQLVRYVDVTGEKELFAYYIDGVLKDNLSLEDIARNDGLTLEDWAAWFTGITFDAPLPIIHFTKFRY